MQPDPRISFDYKPKAGRASSVTHARWFLSGLMVPLLGGVIAYTLTRTPASVSDQPMLSVPAVMPSLPPALTAQEIATPIPAPLGDSIEFVVQRDDTLDRIFRRLKLNLTDLASIRDVPGVGQKLDQLQVGDTIKVTHEDGTVHELSRRISDTQILSVTRGNAGFEAEVIATPL